MGDSGLHYSVQVYLGMERVDKISTDLNKKEDGIRCIFQPNGQD